MSALATLIQHCAGGYSKRIRQEKIKGIQIGRNTWNSLTRQITQ